MENSTNNNQLGNIGNFQNDLFGVRPNMGPKPMVEEKKEEIPSRPIGLERPIIGPKPMVEEKEEEIPSRPIGLERPVVGPKPMVEEKKEEIPSRPVGLERPVVGPKPMVEEKEEELPNRPMGLERPIIGPKPMEEEKKEEIPSRPVGLERPIMGPKPMEEEKEEELSNKIEEIEKSSLIPNDLNNKEVPKPNVISNQKNMFEIKLDEEEIKNNLLNTQIDKIQNNENVYECGRVIKVSNFIVEVSGLDNLSFFEKVKIGDSAIGYVNNILENSVTVAILSNNKTIKVDDKVYSTGEILNTFFSNQFVGRIIDMFGNDLYAENKFENMTKIDLETKTIPIMARGTVNRPLQTGISGIDLIYPIGKGQRQLIVGDKKTGKTQLCLDVIANQVNKNVLCIYVAIGKTKKEVKSIYTELQAKGALSYTIIVSAFNDDKPPIIYLTPYAALSIAEVYMKKGHDVLVVIDDLKRHADAYREISLVSGKTPGRDAYPADIFYTHSRMLEKGCQLNDGGSITILPIVETKAEDITDYITTNIISITDGQIYLSSKLFNKGQKPAIDYGLSVSRLGGAVQEPDIKKLGAAVRLKLLNYLETQDVYQFANLDEMGGNLKDKIIEGKKIMDLLNQGKFSPKTKDQIINDFRFVLGASNES